MTDSADLVLQGVQDPTSEDNFRRIRLVLEDLQSRVEALESSLDSRLGALEARVKTLEEA